MILVLVEFEVISNEVSYVGYEFPNGVGIVLNPSTIRWYCNLFTGWLRRSLVIEYFDRRKLYLRCWIIDSQ